VDPVPYPLLLRKSGIGGNRTRTSVSIDWNSDHWTTEHHSHIRKIKVNPCGRFSLYKDNAASRKIHPSLRNREKGYAYFLGNKMYIIIIIIVREERSIYAGRLPGSATKEKFI
jgi:hypothetical protein